jgi:LysM repeat protein
MTGQPGDGNLPVPAARQTEIELLAALQVFGLQVDASATFGSGTDTILAVQFGDITLGEMLEYLVNKAEPGLDFKLTPPWDLLNTINLHDFTFELDITNFRIGFSYDGLDVSFPLVSLERIEVWYSPATKTRNKSVDLSLFGSFLGANFTSEPGLTWDVLSQPAPAVPGQGTKYFDLEYLGIGQHITLRDTASLATLAQVIQALEGSYQAVDPAKNPLTELTKLKFDAPSGWLFGAKFSALETVTLAAVFNDPVLYGLQLALDGKRAGVLAGLDFEILYRKISDGLGVFHIELKLPDALRKIQAGEADITLPIIDLDVYTNGDFLVDLGFPQNLDFSRSFQIDLIVWVGPIPIPVSAAAGLYFGVLSGQTATQVPQITNGSFAPVIVAGFGVEVGLGKSVSIGPLDAGFFAGFVGILEGVLAWFHPDSDQGSQAIYYKVTGTVGIQIHIWGTVNFAILQASLDIDAYATATVIVESCQPIEVSFEAGVSISLSVKVLFFSITLSFSATISESFTIGQATPTPWVVAATPSAPAVTPAAARALALAPAPVLGRPQLAARGIVRRTGGVVQASPVFAHVLEHGISWHADPALAATTQPALTVGVYLQPMLTAGLAGDRPGQPLGSQPQPQLVATLFVADRGQLEGALAVANADQPLTANTELTGPSGAQMTTKQGDTLRTLAGADGDVFSLGFVNRGVPGLLPVGTAVTLPDGTVTLDGGGYTVASVSETLSTIAAQMLPPFEQLTYEALLWAVESAQLSVQQAQAALGGPAAEPTVPDPTTPVSASQLHALYADLTDPGTPFPLSRVVDFLTSRAVTFDLRPMPATAPQNPSFTVFPMLPYVQLTADGTTTDFGTGPYQATPAYQPYLAQYFQELAAPAQPAGTPGSSGTTPAPGGTQAAAVTDSQPDSVAAALFTDYFVFILRQLVQAALDVYQPYNYRVPTGSTDTLADIAVRFGIAEADTAEAAVSQLAEANKGSDAFFASGTRLAINRRSTQVAAGETLRTLAARLQLTPLLVALAIHGDTGVLAVDSTIQLTGGSYVVGDGDTLSSIAAWLAAPLDTVTTAAAAVPGLLKPLTTLTLPGGSYVVQPPDTLASIAAANRITLAAVGTAAADVPDLLFAGVGFPLPGTLSWTVAPASSADPATAESLDAIATRFGTTLAAVVAGANAEALALRAGAPVAFGLTAQIRPGESLAQLAGRFRLDPAVLAAALGDQAGLVKPGATLKVNPPPIAASYVIKRTDTLASIAASFGTSPQTIVAANPAVSCQPGAPCWYDTPDASLPRPGMGISVPVGLRIDLPSGLTYQVGSQDTLAGIAARFSLGVADLVQANADIPLAPQATVVLPPITYPVADGDTPLSIAARYGLTVEQLVLANTGVGFGQVLVPDAELLPLGTLVTALARSGSFGQPAGSLARFLLHGLRLPSPDELPAPGAEPADQRLYPMYTLTGQQLSPPVPLPDGYGLTLAANSVSPRPAVTFAGGAGPLAVPLSQDDTTAFADIATQLTQTPPIDLGVLAATRYPPYAVVPRHYALGKPVPWQAAAQPPLRYDPAGASAPMASQAAASLPPGGQPTLLPFPDALRSQVAASAGADPQTGPGLRIGLASGSKTSPAAPTQTTTIGGFGWATKADFGLRQVPHPSTPGQPLLCVYEVYGVDQDASADLRQLLDYARGAGGSDLLTLALLYPLSAASATGPALQSDPVDPAGVLLVKANLSTRSNPPVAASAMIRAQALTQDGAAISAATMSPADARTFLTLLWEATVTNTGGYYLYYRVGQDGAGLPAGLFNQDPTATVSLLVTAFPAGGGSSTIPLYTFHNTALVTDNLADPNAVVYAAAPQLPLPSGAATLAGLATSLGTSLTSLGAANATTANLLVPYQTITVGGASHQVRPGEDILTVALALSVDTDAVVQAIGADAAYFTPGALAEAYPEWLTARGTLPPGTAGFRLLRTDPDPAASDPDKQQPAPGTPQDAKTRLEVLFNLVGYHLVTAGGFQASADGLPAGPARPTSGPLNYQLTAVAGAEPWIYQKQLRIDRFAASQPATTLDKQQDPYAGVGTQAQFGWQPQDVFGNRLLAQQAIDLDVGYTDDLVALSQWPSVVTGYQFAVPAGPADPATVQVSIALNTSAYVAAPGDVFAPVVAPGTTSQPVGVAAQATAHRDRYAAIFWQLSHDLAAEVTTTVDGGAPHPLEVAGLAAFASGTWTYLATVAGTTQLTATTAPGDTLASIAATYQVPPAELAEANRSAAQNFAAASLLALGTTLEVENCSTVVQNDTLAGIVQRAPAPKPADPAGLAAANPALILQPGTLLAVGTMHTVVAGDTLAGIATAAGLERTQLASVNGPVTGLLAPGAALTPSYRVASGDTLAGIAGKLSLPLGQVAAAVDAVGTAALVIGAQVVVPVPVHVAAGDTLASLAARFGVSVDELGETSADANVLSAGFQMQLPDGTQVTVVAQDTLGSIAAAHDLTAGALAAANANAAGLLSPGAILASGYRAQAKDTLASVAAAFGVTTADVGAANAQVPGLLVPEQPVLLGQTPYPVQEDDTFASVAAATGATVASLATANADAPGLLAAGQTMALPRHVVLAGTGTHQAAAGDTLAAIAARGPVQVTALGSANSDVTGLLAAGVQLSYTPSDGGPAYSTTTTPHDTLSTVALRLQGKLADAGVAQQVTPALLAEANQTMPCLATGAALLLPPADVTSDAPVTASNPAVVFALETAVTLRRTANVDPAFLDPALVAAGADGVSSVTTALAPALPEGAAGQTLTLQQFAGTFEAAFTTPQLKLATTGSGGSGTQVQQLFVVQYGTAALNYAIGGTPSFFAPSPLSTALWSSPAPVPIRAYTRGQPLGPGQPTSFTGADLDGWAQTFLAELDLVLSSDYAVAAYTLDPAGYATLVQAKQDLAAAIRDSVAAVVQPGPGVTPDLAGAQDALYQQLLITLSTAYQVDTIVQMPVTVTAPADWTGDTAPRLRGQPAAAPYPVSAAATLRSVATDFQAPLELLATALADYGYLLTPGCVIPAQGQLPSYTVASGDTLASIAATLSATAHTQVTVPQLGGAVADITGLLQPGAAINLVRRTYPLAADDTLLTAIGYLALDVSTPAAQASAVDNFTAMNATLPGLFTAGTTLQVPPPVTVASGDTIASLAAAHGLTPLQLATSIAARTDVLAAGVPLTLDGQPLTTRSGESLEEIAAATRLPLATVSAAVQGVAGLLVLGVVIAVPAPVGHVVTSGDTLTTIAAAVGQGATPSWIVTTQLETMQVLQAGTVVAYLSRVAGFSLSDANITLVDSQHDPSPNSLTFLFQTASNTAFSNLAVQLSYQVNQLEYGIEDVPWASGYQSSQWLTFLRPPLDTPIGTVDVPIPLRVQPVPPSVTSQQTTPVTASLDVGPADTIARVARLAGASTAASAGNLLRPGAALTLPGPELALPGPGGPVTHQVAAGESLAAVAGQRGVEVGHLLAVNAHVLGLVQAGARVAAVNGSAGPTLPELRRYDYDYTFSAQRAAQDNLSTSQLQNTTLTSGPSLGVQPTGLPAALAQYAAIRGALEQDLAMLTQVTPVAPVTISAAAGDTLASIAAQLGVDVGYFGGVNAEVAGLLQAGATLTVDGTSATTTAGDTLAGIAAGLVVDVDQVVTAAAGLPLTAGVALTQPQPGNALAWRALQVFTSLTAQVAQGWTSWVTGPAATSAASVVSSSSAVGAVPRSAPRYQVRRGTLATGERTVYLRPDGVPAAVHADDLVVGLRGHVPVSGAGHAGLAPVAFTRLARPLAAQSGVTGSSGATGEPVPGADEFDVQVPDQDVVTTQNIWGEVSITRNASLLPGQPTNPAFVYAVPDVKAATPAVPLITWTDPFDLAAVPFDPPSAPPGTSPAADGTRPLADWLINFFDALLNRYAILEADTLAKIAMRYDLTPVSLAPAVADVPGLLVAGAELPLPAGSHQVAPGDTLASVAAANSIQVADLVQAAAGATALLAPGVLIRPMAVSRNLRVAVDYGFPVATASGRDGPGQQSEIVSRLPVLLCPMFLFDSATDLQPGSGFCASLAQQLTARATARGLPPGVGRWVLDVSLYTTLPAAAGTAPAQAPPLLELTDVRLDRGLVQASPAPGVVAPGGTPSPDSGGSP